MQDKNLKFGSGFSVFIKDFFRLLLLLSFNAFCIYQVFSKDAPYLWLFISILLLVVNSLVIFYALKFYQYIQIDSERIYVRSFRNTYEKLLSEFLKANCRANDNHSYFLTIDFAMESIKLKDSKKSYHLYKRNLSNIQELSKFIDIKVNAKTESDFILTTNGVLDESKIKIFNRWGIIIEPFVFLVVVFCVLASPIFYTMMFDYPFITLFCFLGLCLLSFALNIFNMNYIKMNDTYIEFQNYITGKSRVLKLDDIVSVTFYDGGRSAIKSILCSMKDYSSQSFRINSVGEKNRRLIASILRSKRIKVNGNLI